MFLFTYIYLIGYYNFKPAFLTEENDYKILHRRVNSKNKKKKIKQLFELKPRPTKDASPKEKLYNLVNKLSFGLRTP